MNLAGSRVTDEGLKGVAALKGLTSVSLLYTKVSPPAAANLQKALPRCKVWFDRRRP